MSTRSNKPRRYTGAELIAAIRVGVWGLDLGQLDDAIEEARPWGCHEFMLKQRAHLLHLLETNPEAAEYAARWLAATLQLGEVLPLAEVERRRQSGHPPGEYKTQYEPLKTKSQRRGRDHEIQRLKAAGQTVAQIAAAVDCSERTVQRVLNPPK
jgi:DNA-binding NarL/FixJ family response regulator